MSNHYPNLNPEKALIWRITHKDNIPWILDNGLHCASSNILDPDYVAIGSRELIERRKTREISISPKGTLSDYIPFYFTPFSPMMYNIYTGRGDVCQQDNENIVILASSLYKLQEIEKPFIFTDRHAYTPFAMFYNSLTQLNKIDWNLLQIRNFKRNSDDPEQIERYQAEALVHQYLPIKGLLGI
ncbi:MAG: DUF4433 domain-containing protein, partial [Pseudomonadota bacterium]